MLTGFIIPVTIENTATIMVGIIFTALVGQISATSLTANNVINCIYNLMNAVFCVLTTGAAVLVSRHVGAGNREEASRVTGQALLLAGGGGIIIAAMIYIFAAPLIRLIIPTAEPALMQETIRYIRIMMFAYPFQIVFNVGACILRAAGDAVRPLIIVFIHNVLQVLVAYLLISLQLIPNTGIYGAGIAYLVCRFFGGTAIVIGLFRNRVYFRLRLRDIFRIDRTTLRSMVSIGVPTSLEQIAMQAAYLITNSFAVALGTVSATALSVLGSVFSFATIPMCVCSTSTVTMVGHAIGRGDFATARRLCMKILVYCLVFSAVIIALLTLLGRWLCGLYSSDTSVLALCMKNIWMIAAYGVTSFALYIFETALRTGGDVKFVMWLVIFDMFCVMIPFTYLFCFVFHWGVSGFILANSASLLVRTLGEYFRFRTGKWIHSYV